MTDQYLLFYLPFFIILISVEYFLGRRRGLLLYTKSNSQSSIIIGIGQRLLAFIPGSVAGFVWLFVYEHRLCDMPTNTWWYVLALFIGVEFFYYWVHRYSHEIRWLWATHSVHHSTEELNFLASYRLGWTLHISMPGIIYTPLFFIGFHPTHALIMIAANLSFQSLLHTELVRKLGPLEGLLNTPSAHRVHHAKNVEYIDKNYGGVLIIWDRMFGTYQEERDDVPVEYGLIKPSVSTNPFRIVLHEWTNIIIDLKIHPVRYWPLLLFGPPGWLPNGRGMTSAKLREDFRSGLSLGE